MKMINRKKYQTLGQSNKREIFRKIRQNSKRNRGLEKDKPQKLSSFT